MDIQRLPQPWTPTEPIELIGWVEAAVRDLAEPSGIAPFRDDLGDGLGGFLAVELAADGTPLVLISYDEFPGRTYVSCTARLTEVSRATLDRLLAEWGRSDLELRSG